MIIVDENRQEYTDEQKTVLNAVAIRDLDKEETEKVATYFYNMLSGARTFVFHALNPSTAFMILSSAMAPSTLGVFDKPTKKPQTTPPPTEEENGI